MLAKGLVTLTSVCRVKFSHSPLQGNLLLRFFYDICLHYEHCSRGKGGGGGGGGVVKFLEEE